ncbi:MAG: nucleoside transporter C-terminal domain-containing protein, partial [Thermodesulfobacteriota bacterium]
MAVLQAGFGIVAMLAIAFLFSEDRRSVPWKLVLVSIVLQFALALVLLKFPASQQVFVLLNKLVEILEESTRSGTSFVFGYLGGGDIPFKLKQGAKQGNTYILAFRGLPLILLLSALSSLLFYWKVLPVVVRFFARGLQRTLGVSGAEGVGIAANIFLGMVEAPLFIKRYISGMQRGEIFAIMATGMATIAGTVMVLYASILKPVLPNAMGHLLVASILSAPAAVAVSRIMVPAFPEKNAKVQISSSTSANNSMEAIANGALEGLSLLLNIVAMLIVLVALVALVNNILGLLPEFHSRPLTMQRILGWVLAPLAW